MITFDNCLPRDEQLSPQNSLSPKKRIIVRRTITALNVQLGLPSFICGAVTTSIVLTLNRQSPWPVIKGVSWGVLPLIAGSFVLVEALDHTGAVAALRAVLHAAVGNAMTAAAGSAALSSGLHQI